MGLLIANGTTRCRTGKMAQAVASRTFESGHNIDWFATLGRVADRHSKPFDGNGLSGPLREQWCPERVEISGIENRGKFRGGPAPHISGSLITPFADKASNDRIDVGNNNEKVVWLPDQDLLATERSGTANMVTSSRAPSPWRDRSARSPELKLKRPVFEFLGT